MVLFVCSIPSNFAQVILPDILSEPSSAVWQYYENKGQIIDYNNNVHNEIKFYTDKTSPLVYFANDKVSFVAHQRDTLGNDTTYRLDMTFMCNQEAIGCSAPNAYEQTNNYINYYQPHCGTGITEVQGYSRVIYENVFPNTDIHFYSNQIGLKSYISLKPGSDPNQLLFYFEGQDSIKTLLTGELDFYVKNRQTSFGSLGNTAANDELITQFSFDGELLWSTYYGGIYNDGQINGTIPAYPWVKGSDVKIAIDENNNAYVVGVSMKWQGMANNGIVTQNYINCYNQPQLAHINELDGSDIHILMFNPTNQLTWATNFGGEAGVPPAGSSFSSNGGIGSENVDGIAIFKDQSLYITGTSKGFHTPYECPSQITGLPYCDPTFDYTAPIIDYYEDIDIFISKFCLYPFTVSNEVATPSNPFGVYLYPNPANTEISLTLPNHLKRKTLMFCIYDAQGKPVFQRKESDFSLQSYKILVQQLPVRLYILHIFDGETNHFMKFLKD